MRYWFVALTLGTSLLCCGSILWRISDTIPYCRSIVLGDLDGDGDLDAFLANGRHENTEPNKVWMNDGTGRFVSRDRLSVWAALGVVVLSAMMRTTDEKQRTKSRIAALVMLIPVGLFAVYCGLILNLMWYPRSYVVSLGDLDGDGDLDALVGNGHTDDTGSPNTVWLNDGAGHFIDSGQLLGQRSEHSGAVALGDLDGDGDLDAIFGNESPNTIWLNDGAGQFGNLGEYWMKPDSMGYLASKAMVLGDVDADGDLDALVGNCCRGRYEIGDPSTGFVSQGYADSHNMVWLNDGSGRFADSGQLLGNESTLAVALGDVDGDGDLDAFVGNKRDRGDVAVGSPANKVWLNDGIGHFTDSGQEIGRSNSYAVSLGDVDGDGDLDAFVGNDDPRASGQANKVWLNDGTGRFADSGQNLGHGHTRLTDLIDADGDGDLDAFVDNDTVSQIWLNDGAGRFLDSGQRIRHSNRFVVNVGDVDGDGDTDVFAAHYDKGYRVWCNDGSGRFHQQSRPAKPFPWLVGGCAASAIVGLFIWWAIRHKRN